MTSSVGSSEAPDLAPLYLSYLSAFNEHSWTDILKYVSSTCHATVRGKLCNTSAEGMRPNYQLDFDRCEKHEVSIKEMSSIERGNGTDDVGDGKDEEDEWKKGIRWGLKLVLYDPTMKRTIMVNYWYRLEGGKWMQCWHEILGSVTDDAV